MPIITTAAMISGIVTYMGTQIAKNESVKKLFNDCTDTTTSFFDRLLFKSDGAEKEVLSSLKEAPADKDRQKMLEFAMKIEAKKSKENEHAIKELFEKMSKTEEGGKIVNNIINSKNVVTGNVNTGGGDFIIGDSK